MADEIEPEERIFPFLPGLLKPTDFEPGDVIETDEAVIYIVGPEIKEGESGG